MDFEKLPTRNASGAFHVVVESPRLSRVKLKFDSKLSAFTVSRPLALGLTYPYDWGFVPGTKAPDGDPLDAMVYWDASSYPGVVIPCRALGVIRLEQNDKKGGRQRNDRLVVVPVNAPRDGELRTHHDLSERERAELNHFFVSAVFFAEKDPKILGWGTATEAERLVDECALKLRRGASAAKKKKKR
jgi:inorganic pyrophosphatase